jgi:hypothetical protein
MKLGLVEGSGGVGGIWRRSLRRVRYCLPADASYRLPNADRARLAYP